MRDWCRAAPTSGALAPESPIRRPMRPTVLAPSLRAPRDRRGSVLAHAVAALADASAVTTGLTGTPGCTEDPYTVIARRRVRALNRIQRHLHSYAAPRS